MTERELWFLTDVKDTSSESARSPKGVAKRQSGRLRCITVTPMLERQTPVPPI